MATVGRSADRPWSD